VDKKSSTLQAGFLTHEFICSNRLPGLCPVANPDWITTSGYGNIKINFQLAQSSNTARTGLWRIHTVFPFNMRNAPDGKCYTRSLGRNQYRGKNKGAG